MKKKGLFLSVIIPAYNEAERLPLTLVDIDCYLSRQDFSYEIIIVNNGSTDNTKEVISKFSGFIKKLKLIDNLVNAGKGGGIRRGMLEAKGEWRVCMDADNATSIQEFDKIIPYLKEGVSIFIGSRYLPDSKVERDLPWLRKLAEKILTYWYRFLFLIKGIKDVHCGWRCFSDEAAIKIFSLSRVDNWASDVEVIALAQKLGCQVKEISISWRHDMRSKMLFIDYLKILCQTIKIRKRLWQNKII